jgi:hypothetical protein
MESKIPQYNTRIQLPKSKDMSGANYEGMYYYYKIFPGFQLMHIGKQLVESVCNLTKFVDFLERNSDTCKLEHQIFPYEYKAK